ncbi:hypothetical protein PC129_g8571 [Phytophthora cactorum]|uniref:Uncharacterized protein n=1 Tax=Phytophthora cactorum TaxID=29920 RepID=A0A329SQF5_9STRA|nr:hypothetical protein Pcac1_g24656 [Phytophthora cactorum]KAG2836127.1 hypothetical protein PC112_g5406 [Phytophthora cactorum]KAG2847609.1 hypothetical protein PC111_g725 [Phytophthora cactorum]KAG2866080.1 hypothetical protein PC113_g3142 [Phytophthora cactorum]KAG2932652.1 hypothetical protein PC114_g1788 [Phytophthora cactorum]
MLTNKRPRRAAAAEDSLDPRVMTERQQLAFLLRATAPSDASSSSSDSDSSSDSEDDEPPRRRRPNKRSKTRATRGGGKTSPSAADAPPVIYCGRGRPPKNSIKLPKNMTHPHGRPHVRMSPRSHNTRSGDTAVAAAIAASLKADKLAASRALKAERKERDVSVKQEKTSPSSASDVAMLNSSAGAPFCALCCDLEPFCDAPLFLCPACDQKYPTQQALGRVCMT